MSQYDHKPSTAIVENPSEVKEIDYTKFWSKMIQLDPKGEPLLVKIYEDTPYRLNLAGVWSLHTIMTQKPNNYRVIAGASIGRGPSQPKLGWPWNTYTH